MNQCKYDFSTKEDLLSKLRAYADNPDDENIRYKNIIRKTLLNCPELLYALNNSELESELFDESGNLLVDENTGELTGEVDRYFGDNSNIRESLFIPDTQTEVNNYICYQVMFDSLPKHAVIQKYTEITFTIFVNGKNRTDKLTGIQRHDLIASIIREKFNWSSIFGMQAKLIMSRESITDNNYLVRTLVFKIEDLNGIVHTPYNDKTYIRNNEYWT